MRIMQFIDMLLAMNMLNTSVADSKTNIIIFDIPFKMI